MHLSIAGRADPLLPLARLRARGQLTELRAADLRFTPDEAAAFLNDVMGLGLPAEDIAVLDARTEGWIAGLQMAALSMRGRKDVTAFIKAFSGSHRFVLDYLVEEVLDRQSSDTQDFLLKTSILERMTAPLCDAVLEIGGRRLEISSGQDQPPISNLQSPISNYQSSSQQVLEQLEAANLFIVPLDDERRWYRYHHLFADLLRSRLEQTRPDQAPVLHRRASEWYEQNGLVTEAVEHALAAGDTERVARLVAGNTLAMLARSELVTLIGQLNALPNDVLCSQPWLCVARAWALAYAGQLNAIEPMLQNAEKALDGLEEYAESQRIAGHVAAVRAYAAFLRWDARTPALARKALEHLAEQDLAVRGFVATILAIVLRGNGDFAAAAQVLAEARAASQVTGDSHIAVNVLCELATLQIMQGRLHEAAATCRDALQIADMCVRQSGRQLPVAGYAHARMSTVLREWNDLETATRHAREGIKLGKQWGQADTLILGYDCLAGALRAMGDINGMLDALQNARRIANNVSPQYSTHVAAWEARGRVALGDVAAASRWMRESKLSADDEFEFRYVSTYVILARVLIAQGQRRPGKPLDEASKLLTRLLKMTEAAGAMGRVIEILVLQAITLQAQGKMDQALISLERALSLAEPEGYVRTFIDEGAPMGKLLRQAAAQGIKLDYVSALLTALESETKAKDIHSSLIESLSERELEVLRLLATGLSNKEIAQTLIIAVGTVKQHLKSIYGKLQVHNRTEAASRARDLGLL
jgi:LuxR family maltose regulon positive regulatory protein